MNLASALLKQVLVEKDFESWGNLRKHYLTSEYHTLYTIINKHFESNHELPSFEELKFGIRDAQTRSKVFAIESVDVDVPASQLLEYVKNEYAQREILDQIDKYIETSVAFESAEESLISLQQIIHNVEQKVDIRDPAESMERMPLFESDEDLAKYISLGLNEEYDDIVKFGPTDYILIGGRRGAGKSVVCSNLVVQAKRAKRASIYFTIEMDARQTMQRICAVDLGIPLGRLRVKSLSEMEWNAVAKWWCDRREHGDVHYKKFLEHRDFDKLHQGLTREPLTTGQIHIIYDPALTLAKINTEITRIKSIEPDLALVVVDYINQVKLGTPGSKQYEWTGQIEISKTLKSYAQEFGVPFISPYQIDATGEARFAKGILDSADAAFTLNAHTHEDGCITFDCVKMRGQEERSFTSEINWNTLHIGPGSKEPPKKDVKVKGTKLDKSDNTVETAQEDVPWDQ